MKKTIQIGKEKTRACAQTQKIGTDYYIKVWGNDAHIGAVVSCENNKTKTIRFGSHKEHIIFEPMAKKISKAFKARVIIFGGAHLTNPTKKELKQLITNLKKLANTIIKKTKEKKKCN
jgi:hypothetical protein